jgi:cobalt/nickel transport system ATP-binding protein
MSIPLFRIENATYRYHDVTALEDLSLTIREGERIAILGANGSGKSTLLRLLAGLYFAANGRVLFCDQVLSDEYFADEERAFEFRRRVGLVFQNSDAQLFNATVFDEIAFGPLQLRWPKEKILERVREMLELMEIAPLKDRSPHRLSGGEKKRVALAATLALDPGVLLLDEPTAALDPASRSRMIDFLVDSAGVKTVVTATHDLDIVADIADRCLVLQRGRLVAEGTPDEILSNEFLLQQAHLIHAHRHRHADGVVHSHPHLHPAHGHEHSHE